MTILMNCTKRQFCILRWPIIIPILTEMDEQRACSIYGIWCSMGTRLHCLRLFSHYIAESKAGYYRAYEQIESNALITGYTDVTPFLAYFCENVYGRL